MAMLTTVTKIPYFANCKYEILMPALCAKPTATTFALAPIIVALPPKSAPKAKAHHQTCS